GPRRRSPQVDLIGLLSSRKRINLRTGSFYRSHLKKLGTCPPISHRTNLSEGVVDHDTHRGLVRYLPTPTTVTEVLIPGNVRKVGLFAIRIVKDLQITNRITW